MSQGPSKKHKTTKQTITKQMVYGVVWEADLSIEDFDDRTTDDCYGEEIEDAYESARQDHEQEHKGELVGKVYASEASALNFAEKKFVELYSEYWHRDGDEEDGEDESDEERRPKDPSLFKSGDGFTWDGRWTSSEDGCGCRCRHQMVGSIFVCLKPMKVIA